MPNNIEREHTENSWEGKTDFLLLSISIIYITLPLYIFAFGWFKLPYALLFSLTLCIATFNIISKWKSETKKFTLNTGNISKVTLTAVMVLATLWICISGVGGFGYQNYDYFKHNAVLKDLITKQWPVSYATEVNPEIVGPDGSSLVYYLAYYLPSGLVGKFTNWEIANYTLTGWTLLGLTIALLWFCRILSLPQKKTLLALAIFPFLGGLELFAYYFKNGMIPPPFPDYTQILWWANYFIYPPPSISMIFTPQHAIVGWIAISIIYFHISKKLNPEYLLLLPVFLALWSPFSSVGITPFVLFAVFQEKKPWHKIFSLTARYQALILAFFIGSFIFSNNLDVPKGWIWNMTNVSFLVYICFVLVSFGLVAIVAHPLLQKEAESIRKVWLVTLAVLTLIPMYKIGFYNDFAMRVSIPGLFLFWIFVMRALFTSGGIRKIILCFIVVAVTFTGIYINYGHILIYHCCMPSIESVDSVPDISKREAPQYMGELGNFWFKGIPIN